MVRVRGRVRGRLVKRVMSGKGPFVRAEAGVKVRVRVGVRVFPP